MQWRKPWFDSWTRKIPWRRDRLPTPVFLGFTCDSTGKESACNLGDCVRSLGWEDPLEKGKATYSSIMAWKFHGLYSPCQCRTCKRHRFSPWVGKIPWRRAWQPTPVFLPGESHGQRCQEGPGVLQSIGSHRVRHDWSDLACTYT